MACRLNLFLVDSCQKVTKEVTFILRINVVFSLFVFSNSVGKGSRVKILRVPTKWGCQKQMFGHLDNEDDYFALFLQGEFVRL